MYDPVSILEYDVDRARGCFTIRGIRSRATPAFIFDAGYLSWQGLAPGDQEVNSRLHQRLAPLAGQDLALIFNHCALSGSPTWPGSPGRGQAARPRPPEALPYCGNKNPQETQHEKSFLGC